MTKTVQSAPKLDLTRSMSMLEDAQRLTPGGVGGIRRPYNFVVGEYPVFITHGQGGHIFDVDGNEYIDMLCAYGPIILGYVEPEINDAAKAQMDKGFCFSLVQPLQNELEQRLADIMPCGEQTILVKTGSDATNAAVRAMRAHTGRDKIARCGYHGWGDWCVEHHGGVPQAVHELTKEFEYGDLADLERVFAENPGEIAGVIITPVGHPMAKPIIAPPDGYLQAVVDLAHEHGAVVDLRRDPHRLPRRHGRRQRTLRRGAGPHLRRQGDGERLLHRRPGRQARDHERLREGRLPQLDLLPQQPGDGGQHEVPRDPRAREGPGRHLGARHALPGAGSARSSTRVGVPVTKSGIPPMPFLTFDQADDHYRERRTEFYTQCIRRGLFVQPYHHWYICYRHTEADLDRALDVVEESLAYVAQEYPFKG